LCSSKKTRARGLTIAGLSLIATNWAAAERALVQPNAKTSPVSRLPNFFCAVVKATAEQPHRYLCPAFHNLPSKQFMLDADRRFVGRKLNNSQWVIPLKKDMIERQPVRTRACIVC
jgi:hypothetical protein